MTDVEIRQNGHIMDSIHTDLVNAGVAVRAAIVQVQLLEINPSMREQSTLRRLDSVYSDLMRCVDASLIMSIRLAQMLPDDKEEEGIDVLDFDKLGPDKPA